LELLSVLIEAVGHVGEDIKTLNLAAKELKSLHGLIEYCPEVEELDVSNNALTQLDGIPSTTCHSLCAKSNQLDDVTYFGHLTDLEYLDVSENSLTDLDGLADLHRLKELECATNGLAFVDFRDTPFPCLEVLDLSKNKITQVAGLDALPNLTSLTLDSNRLPSILDFLPVMPFLETLSLRSCSIETIPSDLHTRLPALRTLVFDGNAIADIRPLSHMPSLEHLSLAGCQVSRLRQTVFTFRHMEDLISLDLRSNPLTHGFYECAGSEGTVAKRTVDGEIAVRRTVYEVLLAGCLRRKGVTVDGNVLVEKDRSGIWERLIELDVVGKEMVRTEQQ
ncbi:Protein nud1, partial [Oleoguttula sp. CCFEE 5521]